MTLRASKDKSMMTLRVTSFFPYVFNTFFDADIWHGDLWCHPQQVVQNTTFIWIE